MRDTCLDSVTAALASHLAVDPLTIDPDQDLDRDWGCEPLDLVLVLSSVEDDLGIEVPAELLESVRTVADLVDVVRVGVISNDAVVVDLAAHRRERARRPTRRPRPRGMRRREWA